MIPSPPAVVEALRTFDQVLWNLELAAEEYHPEPERLAAMAAALERAILIDELVPVRPNAHLFKNLGGSHAG